MVMSEAESGYSEARSQIKSIPDLTSLSTQFNFPQDVKDIGQRHCSTNCFKRTYNEITEVVTEIDEGMKYISIFPEIGNYFNILLKIGEGTFSSVYLAHVKSHSCVKVALKFIASSSSTTRIENEIRCLKIMGGKDNVIAIHGCLRTKQYTVLIMPYFSHDKFIEYLPNVTVEEIRLYMKALFLALNNVHRHHIIHRDIKPSNFLYNRTNKTFQLIDFGLAHLEVGYKHSSESKVKKGSKCSRLLPQKGVHKKHLTKRSHGAASSSSSESKRKATKSTTLGGCLCPTRHCSNEVCTFCLERNKQVAARAGTPGFRAPEVLLKYPDQTTAVDMWSAGIILLCLLSKRYPFFRAQDDQSAMAQIISLMGSKKCNMASKAYGKETVCEPEVPPTDLKSLCQQLRFSQAPTDYPVAKKPRLSNELTITESSCGTVNQINGENKHSTSNEKDNLPDDVFELLYQCLDVNPISRIRAHDALLHPFIIDEKEFYCTS